MRYSRHVAAVGITLCTLGYAALFVAHPGEMLYLGLATGAGLKSAVEWLELKGRVRSKPRRRTLRRPRRGRA